MNKSQQIRRELKKTYSAEEIAASIPPQTAASIAENNVLNHDIAHMFVGDTEDAIDGTQKLLNKAIDARAAMDSLCESWKNSWIEFHNGGDQRIKDLRMTRMAMESEMRIMMAGFREVRQFFLDKEYVTERDRLKEFVELCERLKALKESGFLDTISDTILRLA